MLLRSRVRGELDAVEHVRKDNAGGSVKQEHIGRGDGRLDPLGKSELNGSEGQTFGFFFLLSDICGAIYHGERVIGRRVFFKGKKKPPRKGRKIHVVSPSRVKERVRLYKLTTFIKILPNPPTPPILDSVCSV